MPQFTNQDAGQSPAGSRARRVEPTEDAYHVVLVDDIGTTTIAKLSSAEQVTELLRSKIGRGCSAYVFFGKRWMVGRDQLKGFYLMGPDGELVKFNTDAPEIVIIKDGDSL